MENTNNNTGIGTGTKSNLTLTGRSALSISGVKKVKSTEPACVIAILDNCSIIISGSHLSVQNVSLGSGVMDITGLVSSIKYTSTANKKFSLKNMFK